MNTNSYFSFLRLGLVMKRDFMENWKSNLYRILGIYAGLLMVMLLGYINHASFTVFCDLFFGAFCCILFIGGFYYASYIMERMNTLQNRISFLMLPATSIEKFVARALYVSIGFLVMMIAALLLAEASRFIFLPLFDLPEEYFQSTVPFVWSEISNVEVIQNTGLDMEDSYHIACLTKFWGWTVLGWFYSLFILGGCYWRKHAFWKTLGVMILVSNLIGFMLIGLIKCFENNDQIEVMVDWVNSFAKSFTVPQVLWCCIIVQTLLVTLNWWLSYRCFTRQQIIKPKFRLL